MKRPRNLQYPATPSKSQKKPKYHEDDDQDRLSMLPEPILHHILSYLPTKDVTKTCVLSKIFNSTWKSFPILDFNQYCFEIYLRKNRKYQKRSNTLQNFCNYVNKTISHREGVLTSISKFKVVVNFNRDASHHKNLNSWLNYAIDNNIKDLDLTHHSSSRTRHHQWRCHVLPESLFRAKSLENLDLFGCQFTPNHGNIGFSLKTLKLSHVYIDQETLQSMVSTSQHLEELSIHLCEGFQAIKVSGTNLKAIDLYLTRDDQVQTVAISAPNLKFLSHGGGCANVQRSLGGSNNFQSLKEFILHDMDITDGFFRGIPKFPQLEKMELTRCCFLESVQISNVRVLGCLSICQCLRMKEIEVHVSCLSCFRYNGVMYKFPEDLKNVSDKFRVFSM